MMSQDSYPTVPEPDKLTIWEGVKLGALIVLSWIIRAFE